MLQILDRLKASNDYLTGNKKQFNIITLHINNNSKNMRKIFYLTLILFLTYNITFAQDFDVYPRTQDDKVEMPEIQQSLSLNEFQLLSRDIRMMDAAYAAIVPGYVHFKAKDNSLGYVLLGTRVIGYAGLYYTSVKLKADGQTLLSAIKFNNNDESNDETEQIWSYNTYKTVIYTSMGIIITTFLFDWIHGKMILEKKQELIRYKYSVKLKLENSYSLSNSTNLIPGISLTYTF